MQPIEKWQNKVKRVHRAIIGGGYRSAIYNSCLKNCNLATSDFQSGTSEDPENIKPKELKDIQKDGQFSRSNLKST